MCTPAGCCHWQRQHGRLSLSTTVPGPPRARARLAPRKYSDSESPRPPAGLGPASTELGTPAAAGAGPDGGPLAQGAEPEGPATECQSHWPSAQVRPQARTGSASLTPDESGLGPCCWLSAPEVTQPQASMQSGGGPPGVLVDAADLRLAPVPSVRTGTSSSDSR